MLAWNDSQVVVAFRWERREAFEQWCAAAVGERRSRELRPAPLPSPRNWRACTCAVPSCMICRLHPPPSLRAPAHRGTASIEVRPCVASKRGRLGCLLLLHLDAPLYMQIPPKPTCCLIPRATCCCWPFASTILLHVPSVGWCAQNTLTDIKAWKITYPPARRRNGRLVRVSSAGREAGGQGGRWAGIHLCLPPAVRAVARFHSPTQLRSAHGGTPLPLCLSAPCQAHAGFAQAWLHAGFNDKVLSRVHELEEARPADAPPLRFWITGGSAPGMGHA